MDFQWLNKGNITTENGKIEIYAPAQSDFFCNNGAVSEDLLTKVKKKIQKFKQHKNGAPKQATLHLKFQMVAVRR